MSKKIKSISAVILFSVMTAFSATAGGGCPKACTKTCCAQEQKVEAKDSSSTQDAHKKGTCTSTCKK